MKDKDRKVDNDDNKRDGMQLTFTLRDMSKCTWNPVIRSYLILTEAEALVFPPLPQGRDDTGVHIAA